jgi:hypothetical protein
LANQVGDFASKDLPMPLRIVLSVFVVCIAATCAGAADLPAQSAIGKIFSEPAATGKRAKAVRQREFSGPVIPYSNLPDPVWNRGGAYYGSSWSYYYGGPYYGGSYTPSFVRLPYVCGLVGYCF